MTSPRPPRGPARRSLGSLAAAAVLLVAPAAAHADVYLSVPIRFLGGPIAPAVPVAPGSTSSAAPSGSPLDVAAPPPADAGLLGYPCDTDQPADCMDWTDPGDFTPPPGTPDAEPGSADPPGRRGGPAGPRPRHGRLGRRRPHLARAAELAALADPAPAVARDEGDHPLQRPGLPRHAPRDERVAAPQSPARAGGRTRAGPYLRVGGLGGARPARRSTLCDHADRPVHVRGHAAPASRPPPAGRRPGDHGGRGAPAHPPRASATGLPRGGAPPEPRPRSSSTRMGWPRCPSRGGPPSAWARCSSTVDPLHLWA